MAVIKFRTGDLEFQGSSLTRSTGIFAGLSLGKTLQSPILVLMKPRKNCGSDMTERC